MAGTAAVSVPALMGCANLVCLRAVYHNNRRRMSICVYIQYNYVYYCDTHTPESGPHVGLVTVLLDAQLVEHVHLYDLVDHLVCVVSRIVCT
jgi:hypothetical protein